MPAAGLEALVLTPSAGYTAVILYRTDPAQNMWRWYFVYVQATLFNEYAVICGWGRRGTDQARWRIFPVENQVQADELAQRIVDTKIKRGYYIANESLST